MSKASNFSIVGFFHDRDKDPVDFVR
jgi:hypothetical protein